MAVKRRDSELLTREEVHALLRACSRRGKTGPRNRALITLLWRAGLRISEALALMPRDLNPALGEIRVRHGKGDRARTVATDPGAFAVVDQWLDLRRSLPHEVASPLLCTLAGGPVSTSDVRQRLPRLAKKAGVDRRVHPHGFRHLHAVELARENVPLPVIQRQLGHRSLTTTSLYLSHFTAADQRGSMGW